MSSKNVSFFESHSYRKPWLYVPLSAINIILAYETILTLQKDHSDSSFVYFFLLISAVSLFFMLLEIRMRIDESGIQVKFFPFHWFYKKHRWEDIEKCYVRSSSPISEFGGWGLRYSLGGYGKAYTLYGYEGIQIDFKNGKKLFIGSRKATEIQTIINQIFTKTEIHE
jgi:hypothetical protein